MTATLWLGAMVIFLLIEAATPMLVSIWFALGALVAAICACFKFGQTACILVFLVVSAVSLILFKLFYDKKLTVKHEPTNADSLIGQKGVVCTDIDPILGKGTVDVKGSLWSAKAEDCMEKGAIVEVERIEGVKLVVKKV